MRIGVSEALISAVNDLFHHTLLNDAQIAARLLEQGLKITSRQVKTIRLKSGWQRHSTGAQKVARTAQTFKQVEQVVTHGPGRIFGRGWMTTYLRQHCGFKAHQRDVAAAQRQLNPEGVAARQPRGRKKRLENYITSGPNFLSLFASTSLLSNLSVCAPGSYVRIEAQRQSYLLLCISRCLLKPAWPNNGPTTSTMYYSPHIAISMARALRTLRSNVYGGNNDSNAPTHGSITLRHFRPKISTGKTSSLTK